MKLWHPHTETPGEVCACVIALPADPLNPVEDGPLLMRGIYVWTPESGFTHEEDESPVVFPAFFWAREADLLAELAA